MLFLARAADFSLLICCFPKAGLRLPPAALIRFVKTWPGHAGATKVGFEILHRANARPINFCGIAEKVLLKMSGHLHDSCYKPVRLIKLAERKVNGDKRAGNPAKAIPGKI